MSTPAQRTRQRDHRAGTRREILAAADRLLRERPYRELTIEIVMAQTDLTRTAFYRHFDDVTDLVLRLMAELRIELATVAERWGASAGSDAGSGAGSSGAGSSGAGSSGAGSRVGSRAPTAAHEGLSEIVDFFVRHGPLVRAIAEAAVTDEQIERGYRRALDGLIDITAEALERLVGQGQLQIPDPRELARALNLMNEAYLLDEFGREPFGDREVALATLETVWLRVVGPTAWSANRGEDE